MHVNTHPKKVISGSCRVDTCSGVTLDELKERRGRGWEVWGEGGVVVSAMTDGEKTKKEEWRDRRMSMEKREECSCQQNQMAVRQTGLKKIQLKCGVKTGFEVGHGA